MKHEWTQLMTNGKMARLLGIDPKTLRKWARKGLVPSYINQHNRYRYYFKPEVLQALKKYSGATSLGIDQHSKKP